MNCKECPLYRTKDQRFSVNIPPRKSFDLYPEKPVILVIGQAPGKEEDLACSPFVGPSGQFLQLFLDRIEVDWVLDNAARCFPGRAGSGDMAPERKAVEICSEGWKDSLKKYKPKVVICLGRIASEAVLGKQAPKNLNNSPLVKLGEDTYVICAKHPANHISGRDDLTDNYITIFQQAEKIAISGIDSVQKDFSYKSLKTAEAAYKVVRSLPSELALDVETDTTSKDIEKLTIFHPKAKLISISVTYIEGKSYRTYTFSHKALSPEIVSALICNKTLIGHNIKYDLLVLSKYLGVNVTTKLNVKVEDTFLWFYLTDQSRVGNSLKKLAGKHFFAPDWSTEVWNLVDSLTKALGHPATFYDVLQKYPDTLLKYNAFDTFYTARLYYEIVNHDMTRSDGLLMCYRWLTKKAIPALLDVELNGLPFNKKMLESLKNKLIMKKEEMLKILKAQKEVQLVEAGFTKLRNRIFMATPDIEKGAVAEWKPRKANVKSVYFLSNLAELLEHHTGDRTEKTGRLQFNSQIMHRLAGVDKDISELTRAEKIFRLVYNIRKIRDMESKFIKSILDYIVDTDKNGFGRVHTTYQIGKVEVPGSESVQGTKTGRLSSTNPNLQNLSKKGPLRYCVVTKKTRPFQNLLWEFDYDRIELVVSAVISEDPKLLRDVEPGRDMHAEMGKRIAELLGKPYDEDMRSLGKTVNFGKLYKQTPQAFSELTGLSLPEAVKIHEMFDRRYKKLTEFFQEIESDVRKGKLIHTIFNRRRSFNLVGNAGYDNRLIREACNFVIQSAASDITLYKLKEVIDFINLTGKKAKVVNIVHDSIWMEFPLTDLEFIRKIVQIMQDPTTLPIADKYKELLIPRLRVSISKGRHMGRREEFEIES